jgi:hypothetical protein
MTNKFNRLAAKLTTAAMVVSMFAMSMPAKAATVTAISDQMSRLQTGITGVTHSITLTLPNALVNTDTVTIQMGTDGGFTAGSIAGIGGSLNTCAPAALSGQDLVFTVGGGGCTAGSKTITGVTYTNPAAADLVIDVIVAGSVSDSGKFGVSILADDTINVTASVTQSFTYDIRVAANCASAAPAGGDYEVALGPLTPGTVVNDTELICMKLKTNADGGAVVEVDSEYGGLYSATVSYTIDSAGEDLSTAANEGYGLCDATSNDIGGNIDVGSYTFDAVCPTVAELVADTFTTVADTDTDPVDGGTVSGYFNAIVVEVAAVSNNFTPSAPDYLDELNFRAYGTF